MMRLIGMAHVARFTISLRSMTRRARFRPGTPEQFRSAQTGPAGGRTTDQAELQDVPVFLLLVVT
jgi:hypothetical protein